MIVMLVAPGESTTIITVVAFVLPAIQNKTYIAKWLCSTISYNDLSSKITILGIKRTSVNPVLRWVKTSFYTNITKRDFLFNSKKYTNSMC